MHEDICKLSLGIDRYLCSGRHACGCIAMYGMDSCLRVDT